MRPIQPIERKIEDATEEVARAAGRLDVANENHAANQKVLEQARARLAALQAMDNPTPSSLSEEEGVRRKIAKLEAIDGDLSAAAAQAKEKHERARAAVKEAEHDKLSAEVFNEDDAIRAWLLEVSNEFDVRMRENAAKAAKAQIAPLGLRMWSPHDFDAIGHAMRRAKGR